MSRFVTYGEICAGKVADDFGVSKIAGSSLTIPGQGSDLAQIIASIVKLPPLDERTFDVPSGVEPDLRSLAVKTDLDGLYTPEGVNLAKDAKQRQKAKEEAEKAKENAEKEPSDADKAE